MVNVIESVLTDLPVLINQARVLATGLQQAAPSGVPSLSVQYLFERATQLERAILEFGKYLSHPVGKEERANILTFVKEVMAEDVALRDQYQVNNKFAFLRDRLQVIFSPLEESAKTVVAIEEEKKAENALSENNVIVYVYLFNAKGAALSSWESMLTPKLFYEYSVNRPIYADRVAIDALIREKADKRQHACFSVTVKSSDIILSGGGASKDSGGSSLIKVREGGLSFDKLNAFFCDEGEYRMNEMGQLVKKQ